MYPGLHSYPMNPGCNLRGVQAATLCVQALLIGTFEAAPWIKRQVLASLGRDDVSSYKQEGPRGQK